MRGRKETLLICSILWDKCQYYQNHYINPSQETWRKWLRNQGGLDISRRTLNRYFKSAANRMQLIRIRRIKHHPIKGMVFLTTLYSISYLGLLLLYQTGRITWQQLRDYLRHAEPFKSRVPKRDKKGITPGEDGFYKNAHKLGDLLKSPY